MSESSGHRLWPELSVFYVASLSLPVYLREREGIGAGRYGTARTQLRESDTDALHAVILDSHVGAAHGYAAGTPLGKARELHGIVEVEHLHLHAAHGITPQGGQ